MKSKNFLFMMMIIPFLSFGQGKGLNEVSISPAKFSESGKSNPLMPEGYAETIENYLHKNVIYPQKAAENYIQGTSIVQFVVSAQGEIGDFKVINSVSTDIDEEVIRVLNTTDRMWTPGTFNGEPVDEVKEVSIVFKLTDGGKHKEFDYLARKYYSRGNEMLFLKKDAEKALKFYDKGIVFLPKDKTLLLLRGMARYEAGDMNGACQDWNRIKSMGGLESDDYLNVFCGHEGHKLISQILKR